MTVHALKSPKVASLRSNVSPEEWQARVDLAAAYRLVDLYGMTDERVLRELMAAGLDSLPGGGAEIFAERVRRKIAHDKCGTDRYLEIHRTAHRLGAHHAAAPQILPRRGAPAGTRRRA